MASVASLKWLRLAKLKGVSRSVCRLHFSTDVTKRERFVDKMKKFVFGEGAPPEQNEEAADSYFDLAKGEEPSVYSMEMHEVVDKVENIVKGTLPEATCGQWENHSVSDLVVKYKVLSRCYEEFGLLVPNFQLSKMNSVQDVIHFYTSAKPKDTRTFKSIDMDNLPPNLNIGGKVPWKNVSL